MDHYEMIKSFILEDTNVRRERFEIAWDIWENFGRLKLGLKSILIRELTETIRSHFGEGWKVDSTLHTFGKGSSLSVFKDSWESFLCYCLESVNQEFHQIRFGISKWEEKMIFPETTTQEIQNTGVEGRPGPAGAAGWYLWYVDADRDYGGAWEKAFYLRLLDAEGRKEAVGYYVNTLDTLREHTENLMDRIVGEYSKQNSVVQQVLSPFKGA